ncbi:MAG: hypothetical protein WCY09_05480 [Candidatus Omnitrophota bacterium]
MPGFVWSSNSGCLLPFLIIFNLFFGRLIFNSTRLWLGVEAVLVLIFVIKINILARKINRQFKPNSKIVDIQGYVVEEDKKLK